MAVIAKQLSEFLQLYSRETELFHAECSGNQNIAESSFHVSFPNANKNKYKTLFQTFLALASESDLEEVLTLHMRLYKCAHAFLGRCAPPPTLLKAHGFLQCLPQLCSLSTNKVIKINQLNFSSSRIVLGQRLLCSRNTIEISSTDHQRQIKPTWGKNQKEAFKVIISSQKLRGLDTTSSLWVHKLNYVHF